VGWKQEHAPPLYATRRDQLKPPSFLQLSGWFLGKPATHQAAFVVKEMSPRIRN